MVSRDGIVGRLALASHHQPSEHNASPESGAAMGSQWGRPVNQRVKATARKTAQAASMKARTIKMVLLEAPQLLQERLGRGRSLEYGGSPSDLVDGFLDRLHPRATLELHLGLLVVLVDDTLAHRPELRIAHLSDAVE